MNPEIQDEFSLLKIMMEDSRHQPSYYNPGPYWYSKVKNAMLGIGRFGIKDFRGSSSLIGMSFTDNFLIDIRVGYYSCFGRILHRVTKFFPFRIPYDEQIQQTRNYADEVLRLSQEILDNKPQVRELLRKYQIPYSLLGGCKRVVKIDGNDYAIHYLNLLEQHDNVSAHIQFDIARTVFETGGGFGINIHLLLENYPNIRKVIFLELPPNLYVGTQYLKAFYGEAVFDYRKLKNMHEIKFSDTDDLEIFCIAPWQIEKLQVQVDIFMDSHSFVAIPKETVTNYVQHLMSLPGSEKTAIVLVTYDNYDLNTTLDPACLPKFFSGREFIFFKSNTLMYHFKKNLYYLSVGNIPVEETPSKLISNA